jgi:hypothetical protein
LVEKKSLVNVEEELEPEIDPKVDQVHFSEDLLRLEEVCHRLVNQEGVAGRGAFDGSGGDVANDLLSDFHEVARVFSGGRKVADGNVVDQLVQVLELDLLEIVFDSQIGLLFSNDFEDGFLEAREGDPLEEGVGVFGNGLPETVGVLLEILEAKSEVVVQAEGGARGVDLKHPVLVLEGRFDRWALPGKEGDTPHPAAELTALRGLA